MKKILGIFVLMTLLLIGVPKVKAASTDPFESIDFCGIVKVNHAGGGVRLKMAKNTCKVTVKLKDDTYTVVSGDGVIKLEEGKQVHKIVLKDAQDKETTYEVRVTYNNPATNGNPSTGDNTIAYVAIATLSLLGIAVGVNKVRKYNQEI